MNDVTATTREVRKFGFLFSLLCGLGMGYLLYVASESWKWFALAGVLFLTGAAIPAVLRPVYVLWMKLAYLLNWVNTRLLLGLLFYLLLTPIGLVLRLLGKDLLQRKIDQSSATYWLKRGQMPLDPKRYEHLF